MRAGKGTLIDKEFEVDESIVRSHYAAVTKELKEIREAGRSYVSSFCRLCKYCNGVNCPGIPTERGASSERNYRKLQQIKISYETIYEGGNGTEIDTRIELFGHRFRAPIASAPFGMIGNFNPTTHYKDDHDFTMDLIKGTGDLGVFAFTPDTFGPRSYIDPLRAIKDSGKQAIPVIKPWGTEEVQEKIRMADEVGVMAIGQDVDCIGLPNKSVNGGRDTYPRSAAQIRELFSITKTPFILKGINSVRSAVAAVEAGASGIVVSNHGGNCLDQALATCETLPQIKDAVGDAVKILDVQAGPWRNGGYTSIQGGVGWFKDRRIPASEKAATRILHYDEDGALIMGLEGGEEYLKVPANNFVGCIGVAPKYDRIPSDHMNKEVCGNVDIPQFKKGSTVVLRCNVDGGLLNIGDVHAAQGDGEITGCAVESQGRTTVRVSLIKKEDMPYYGYPQVENEKMIGSVGICPHIDMDHCCMEGYADLIYRIEAGYGISQADAYMLLCIAGKIQIGNGLSAVCMIDKEILKKYKKK